MRRCALLDAAAVSYAVVLTKGDEVKAADRGARIAETLEGLSKHVAAFPEVMFTSARTGEGIAELARAHREAARRAERATAGLTLRSGHCDGRSMRTHYNAFAGGDVGRIEALSDGIFAFAATVLVLDFRTPDAADIHSEAELLSALLASSHRLMPWLLSLLTLGIFWVAQQTQLSQLARSNRDLTWLHLVFLAIITVLPFTTRLLADFFTYRTAFLIYWANIFLLGVAVYVTWAYSERAKLLREDAPRRCWARFGGGSSSPSRSTRWARSSASPACRSGLRSSS